MSTPERQRSNRALLALLLSSALAAASAQAGQTVTATGAVGHYEIQRAPSAMEIDGSLDELGWQLAAQINGFQRILHHYPQIERPTRAKMLWDDDALYIGFACTDPDIWAIYAAEDDPMWSEEVVEVFIDPDGDGENYLELEVNPLHAWVDLLIHRAVPRLGAAIEWDIAGLRSAVRVHGTVNDSLSRDTGWTVEIAIPWAAMADSIRGGARPAAGDEWRLNLYRIERKGGRRLKQQIDRLQGEQPVAADLERLQKMYEDRTEYTAWSATWRQGFHDPTRFGVVRFVE